MRRTPEQALQVAIQIAGGPAALAAEIGTTRQAVRQWTICPAKRVEAVAAAARKAELKAPTKRDLRPDLYK